LSLAAWRTAQGQRASPHQALRHKSPPRQGRWRPTPRFRSTGDVTDFALETGCGLKVVLFVPGRAAGGPRRDFVPQTHAAQLRFEHTSALARPPRSYWLTTPTRRKYIAARDKAAALYNCRVVLLLLRKRRGAAGLGKPQGARGQNKYFATAPAHTPRVLHGAHSSRGRYGKTTSFSLRDHASALAAFPVSRAKLP
jgi:hypothetical protein